MYLLETKRMMASAVNAGQEAGTAGKTGLRSSLQEHVCDMERTMVNSEAVKKTDPALSSSCPKRSDNCIHDSAEDSAGLWPHHNCITRDILDLASQGLSLL
ncbi:hypothetical protein llap_8492 [Limosa lapponica baueri]|uniref:Uncharacterized protein n=1 Tax=Limosa lapponica baueri TaxID=1758121 RepID=A0A2I0U574_LIMLA|nr:hypothetical protein llap_8492 [Limosa lapponica baueri]